MRPENKSKYLAEFLEKGKIDSLKIVDCHTHMGSINGTRLPVSGAEDCIRLMEEENIGEIWCAAHGDCFHPSKEKLNGETKSLISRYPGRIRGYYVFNPNQKELYISEFSEVLCNPGFIGFKVLPNYHNHALDGEGYEEMLAFAEENRLAVLCHTWGKLPHNSTKEVAEILRRHPKLIFIMGHSAPGECEKAIQLACEYEDAYLDLCDIHRHSGIVERMVRGAGAHKVLFGTDMPWYDPNYCTGSVLCAHITDEEREMIFCGNAKRILQKLKQGTGAPAMTTDQPAADYR